MLQRHSPSATQSVWIVPCVSPSERYIPDALSLDDRISSPIVPLRLILLLRIRGYIPIPHGMQMETFRWIISWILSRIVHSTLSILLSARRQLEFTGQISDILQSKIFCEFKSFTFLFRASENGFHSTRPTAEYRRLQFSQYCIETSELASLTLGERVA